jgi:hypothetical protein
MKISHTVSLHVGLISLLLGADATSALEFDFRPAAGTEQAAIDGFNSAGNLWAARLSDPIKVVIDIDFRPLDPGVLGQTGSEDMQTTYSAYRMALTGDKTSASDNYFDNIPQALSMLLNRTANSIHGSGSDRLYVDDDADANNTTIRINRANAKALRILEGEDPAPDASITFSSDFRWDFDPSDGTDANSFSFIAVAAHEIGHALGFVSGVDILDLNSRPGGPFFPDDQFGFVSPADVVRISAESVAEGAGVIDWGADARVKYFALGAATNEAGGFSTGRTWGDGQQASHWKDDLGLGLMDPTAAPGEHPTITALDLQLFDLIGYDLTENITAEQNQPVVADQSAPPETDISAEGGASQTVRTGPDAAAIAFSASPDVPILELSYEGGMIKNPDPTPFVSVYGDGRVRIHYPAYHVKAGTYTLTLPPEELRGLLRVFAQEELINTEDLNLTALASPQGQGAVQSPVILPNDHGVVSNVTIRAQSITPVGAAAPRSLDVRELSIPNIAVEAAARSGNSVLQDFAAGVEKLEALAQRSELAPQ